MPFAPLTLQPGVNTEATPTALRAGFAQAMLSRFRSGFFEKMGGWVRYYAFALAGAPRALQAWLDLNGSPWLAIGTTEVLDVIDENDNLTSITPQTKTTDSSPNFSTTASSATVTVTDSNISNPTTYDTVELRTPVAVGGIVLSGSYQIASILSATQFTITAADSATTTRANATITAITAANPGSVTTSGAHGFSSGDLIYISGVVGMTQVNNRLFTITSTGANTFTIGVNTSAYTAYSSAGTASPSSVPFFTTTAASSSVTVTLQDHGLSAGGSIVFPLTTTLQKSTVTITNASPAVVTWLFPVAGHGMSGGETIVFTTTGTLPSGLTAGTTYYVLAAGITATTFRVSVTPGGTAINTGSAGSGIHTGTVGAMTVQGTYSVLSVTDVDNFVIAADTAAVANSVDPMNSGNVEFKYYIALGAAAAGGTAYSFSTYSSGPYSGTGASSTAQTGTAITATDWTLDNWNATLIACPANGGIYAWTPNTGFQNEQLIATAPLYNSGVIVAAPRLALLAYGSTVTKDIGLAQDPLVYKVSDLNDYTFWETNVVNPTTGATSQAFESRIPTGNAIKAAIAAPNQLYLWTDLDLWTLNYVNLPQIWDQQQAAANCGTVGRHAVGKTRGVIVWWGANNFYGMKGGAVDIIPCTIWKSVFQNINRTYADRCHVVPVESANEFWFYWPSADSTGECDLLAKWNLADNLWDGPHSNIARSAGIGQSVVGNPVLATPTGLLYQHETGYDADGQPIIPILTTGEFYLSEGQDFVFVDQFFPDFFYTTADGSTPSAIIQVTFYVKDYPGDTARTYGPFNMTSTTTKLDVRFRGRMCQIQMTSTDTGSYWRLGKPYLRISSSGRR